MPSACSSHWRGPSSSRSSKRWRRLSAPPASPIPARFIEIGRPEDDFTRGAASMGSAAIRLAEAKQGTARRRPRRAGGRGSATRSRPDGRADPEPEARRPRPPWLGFGVMRKRICTLSAAGSAATPRPGGSTNSRTSCCFPAIPIGSPGASLIAAIDGLAGGTLSITEVAPSVRYLSDSAFGATFKREISLSPRRFAQGSTSYRRSARPPIVP